MEIVKKMTSSCPTCSGIKLHFFKPHPVKASQLFERFNLNFKRPLSSQSQNNKYILTIIDNFSQFHFAFPCPDRSINTVIKCLTQLFILFGMSAYVHLDGETSFTSEELNDFLLKKQVATSYTTPYNLQGNEQVVHYNGIIWRSMFLAAKTHNLNISQWKEVQEAFHSIRSLFTATNCTPHK